MAIDQERLDARMKAYDAQPQQKHNRAMRNKARRQEMRYGKVKKGDGKDVDHIRPLSKGGGTGASNLRVITVAKNRGHGMSVRPKGVSRFLTKPNYGKFRV